MLERRFSPRMQGICFGMRDSDKPWLAAVLGVVLENRCPGLSGCSWSERKDEKTGKSKRWDN